MRVNHPSNNAAAGNETVNAKQGGRVSHAETKSIQSPEVARDQADKAHHGGGGSGARAEISPKSKEFAQAKSVASDAPDIREDRVAEMKRRISEGTYHVDHEALADRLVDDHLRMSGIG